MSNICTQWKMSQDYTETKTTQMLKYFFYIFKLILLLMLHKIIYYLHSITNKQYCCFAIIWDLQ